MLPVATFAAGLIAGAVGLQMLKKSKAPKSLRDAADRLDGIGDKACGKAREGLDKAQSGLRRAATSGLSAVERSAADLRAKLEPDAVEAEPAARMETAPETEAKREA